MLLLETVIEIESEELVELVAGVVGVGEGDGSMWDGSGTAQCSSRWGVEGVVGGEEGVVGGGGEVALLVLAVAASVQSLVAGTFLSHNMHVYSRLTFDPRPCHFGFNNHKISLFPT